MIPRILFTSVCAPYDRMLDFSATDHLAYRHTRAQGLFTLHGHTHQSGLHLMAQNLSGPSVVLENPTLDDFEAELAGRYDYVAISFKVRHTGRLLQMCELIRRKSPSSKIVVGGYGAICGPNLFKQKDWVGKVDFVCYGEGVSFMRKLLGETPKHEISCRLPKEGASLPWLMPRPPGTVGVILSSMGCTMRCPFCVTSAFTEGRYIEVSTARQIAQQMVGYWKSSPMMNSVTIYDENFLDVKPKVDELGRLIRADKTFGLRKLNYAAFGSISALSKYDPEELLLNGLDMVWAGVESKLSPLKKRQGHSPEEVFRSLHAIGIKTIGSWIVGEDFQTPENIEEDLSAFIALDPTFQQMSLLSVVPPLPLWQKLKEQGRIPAHVEWKEYHIYGKTFSHPHFSYEQMLDIVDKAYHRIYFENGPAVMKSIEINLNGYEYCQRSKNPQLRDEKSELFADRIKSYFPLLKTAIACAPSRRVRNRLTTLDERYRAHFAVSGDLEQLSDQYLMRAEKALEKVFREPAAIREEPYRRYTYRTLAERSEAKPYSVEYPREPRTEKGGPLPLRRKAA